jgi:hypothetical protein
MVHPGQNPSEILAQLLAVTTRIHHVYLVWVMFGFTTLVNITHILIGSDYFSCKAFIFDS